ncbi:hypothetical protein BCR37DRAFT_377788 [Protomyces lactucae-debilis]|uniref:Extracellular membrane protein CFEM domain-containing protein n=1 Tax=Protomyces lactucae-debilis TaxID=2754530 RepID=A0A1Y2FQC3_PROLT|nr:uncharacterized protein BCR37DRAFT_377788 [Protomyces lactucae-debilis]ORY84905.1 hypothetical protein BCR37DRAFT_377788 [Protomyces lactucae-debilis]
MKCFIFLLYSSLLFIGKFAPSAASPAAAPAAEPGRTAGNQKGTPTTGQNTNRGQKRLGDDDGAGSSKTQKQAQAPTVTPTPKVYLCYGLKLQFRRTFSDISEDECATKCKEEGKAYKKYTKQENMRPIGPDRCFQSNVCVSAEMLSADRSAALSALLKDPLPCTTAICSSDERINKDAFQCECQATLIAVRIKHVAPEWVHLFKKWRNNKLAKVRDEKNNPATMTKCHYIFIAERMKKEGWMLYKAAWDPTVECDLENRSQGKDRCPCHKSSHKSKSAICTATLQREVALQVPLWESLFTIDLNKEPAEDSAAAATGSSQQLSPNLECTQTFLNSGLGQNEVSSAPEDLRPGYCSRRF